MNDPIRAQESFDAAGKAEDEGDLAKACPLFLESFKLEPKPGTLNALAECYKKSGQSASAWASYRQLEALCHKLGQTKREDYARAMAAELESKLSHLTVAVPSAVPGLRVTRDGAVLDAARWGKAEPVDPGKHVLEARAPGKLAWSTTVDVGADGAARQVEVPVLLDEPWPARKTAGVTLMVASAGGVVLGSIFGALARAKYNNLDAACPTHVHCKLSLGPELDAYHRESGVFVGSFVGASILLIAGLGVLTFESAAKPRTEAFVAPRLGVGYAGVEGRF